jgi:hypothetical protein
MADMNLQKRADIEQQMREGKIRREDVQHLLWEIDTLNGQVQVLHDEIQELNERVDVLEARKDTETLEVVG